MKHKALFLLASLAVMLGLITAPATAAQPQPALAALSPATVTTYDNNNYTGFIAQWTINAGDCDWAGYNWNWGSINSLWWYGHSSVLYRKGSTNYSHCNYIGVRAQTGDWYWTCVTYRGGGIPDYGPPWANKVSGYGIKWNPSCPLV